MPEGFGLPISHSLWVPLQLNDAVLSAPPGAAHQCLGKLAAGVTISAAQAELDAPPARAAADFPATDRHIQPVVKPYVESVWSAVEDSRMQTIVMYCRQRVLHRLAGAVRRQRRDAGVRAHRDA